MKTIMKTVILTVLLALAYPMLVFGADEPQKTNIGGLVVMPYQDGVDGYINYGDSTEVIDSGYIGLFINGSIIKDTEIIVEDGVTLVPVRIVAEAFGAEVEWAPENGRIIIHTKERATVMYIGRIDALVNTGGYFMQKPPRIIDGKTYVPLRFAAEAMNADVAYSDGVDLSVPFMLPGIRHVMISLYPKEWKPLTEEQAVEKIRENLIGLYEGTYGKYTPPDPDFVYTGNEQKEIARQRIGNLAVSSENDRYYVVSSDVYFWIDKYTSDIYAFKDGEVMSITAFDPESVEALTFVE